MFVGSGLHAVQRLPLSVAVALMFFAGVCAAAEPADPATPPENSPATTTQEDDPKSSCSVAGVRSEVLQAEYQDKEICFGVNAYIAEELGKAGLFRFLEEDEAIVERIKTIQEKVWLLREEFDEADLVRFSDEAECGVLAYGRIVLMKESRQRAFAGPANILKKIGQVKIEVSLFIKETGEVFSATGTGRSSKGLWGFLTQGREEALSFDDYMIGQASREAVREAVKKLIEQYRARRPASAENEPEQHAKDTDQ